MQRPSLVDTPGRRPRSRPALFLLAVLSLPLAAAVALVAELLLGGDGRVSSGFFVAAAALTPVIGLGLLVQVVAALAGRTRGLLGELKRFNEEMAADEPDVSEERQRERRAIWEGARDFSHVLVPFLAGLVLQLVVTEAVAVACLAADVDDRAIAIGVGVEVFALFNYMIFFTALLTRLARRGATPHPPPSENEGSLGR